MTFRRRRPPAAGRARTRRAQPPADRTAARPRSCSLRRRARRACRSVSCSPIAAGQTRVENVAARTYHGHAAVLVEEAVERHVRRAVRGERQRPDRRVHRPAAHGARPCMRSRSKTAARWSTIDDVSERARLDAVRTDFVANISHELKTPVGALAVLAEALADDRRPGRRSAGSPSKMVDEAHRAARTIDDLLELSRTELGGAAAKDIVVRRPGDRRCRRSCPGRGGASLHQGHRRQRARRSARRRQPSAARLGGRQPARERRQVQRHRLGGRRRISSRRRLDRDRRHRHRRRHPGPRHRPDLRALLSRRSGPQPRHRWHRTRPVDRSPRRDEPLRRGHGAVPRGRGLGLHHPRAGGQTHDDPTCRSRRRGRAELRRGLDHRADPRGLSCRSP